MMSWETRRLRLLFLICTLSRRGGLSRVESCYENAIKSIVPVHDYLRGISGTRLSRN